MYLVELRPGKEELYRSSDELALAIRNGDVDARSRVYHRATAKWISITLHPQYRAIASAAKEDPAIRPTRRAWSGLLNGATEQPLDPAAVDSGSPVIALHRWRRPLALGIAALLLMSGLQLAFSGPRPPWAGRSHTAATITTNGARKVAPKPESRILAKPQSVKTSPQPALISFSKGDSPEESGTAVVGPGPRERLAILPRAPRLRSKSLRDALAPEATKVEGHSLEALFARYSAAHDSAHNRLQAGMRVARLHRLFAASRLSPAGGVTDTRMSLAGAANFIRVYRQQQAVIEQAYQDTVTATAKQKGWSPKQVRAWYSREPKKEAPTLELLGSSLLATIDSVFGVLHDQAGAYKIRGSAIAFEEPTAGQKYGALRRRVKEQIDAVVSAGGATSGGPTGLLLQAIGTTSLPRET